MSRDVDFRGLAEELESRFLRGGVAPWDDAAFDALALAAFRIQYERIPAFGALCEARGLTPASVERWQDVPVVPTRAFKHIDFAVDDPERVFVTSGTTGGAGQRGRHLVPRASLYTASLLPPFERHVMGGPPGVPETPTTSPAARMPFVSLIPSPDATPSSSLSFMVGAAAQAFASATHWVVDGVGGFDDARLRVALGNAVEGGEPVALLGTALALVHALERLEADPVDPLPPGSRIMETGGFKGSGREIPRGELHERVAAALGVSEERIVSEYGMTELLSQLYEPILSEGPATVGTHVPPPWLKVRALDPATLEEVEPGDPGLLAFFDLANAGSICHVLTEDVGLVVEGRVRLQGRARGAEPRGCSRAMDELMTSAGSGS